MADKPRVLILTPDFPPEPGGIQLLVHRLAATMSRLQPLVVAPAGERATEFDSVSSVPVRRVPQVSLNHRATVARLNVASLLAAREFRPDCVLSAHVVTSPSAALLRRLFDVPVVQYLHGSEVGARPMLSGLAVRHADATIAVSRHTCDLARRVGASDNALHRIPPGVDLCERRPQPRATQPTVITVARLAELYKGHDTIIRALPLVRARVPNAEWIVIGTGPRREQFQRLAEIYGVSGSVRFLGEVSDDERDEWLERAHVFTMPSRLSANGLGGEGFGIVYLEASWHELPIVAGDAGGALDAVVNGETGLLVDANDHVAVAGAVTRLLAEPALQRRLGDRGMQRAKDFAWPMITRQVEDVLLSVVAPRQTARRSRSVLMLRTGGT